MLGEVRAHNEHQRLYDEVAYWAATELRIEVDFVLRRDHQYAAVEVKSAERYNTSFVKGLRAIADLPGLARRIVVYWGRRAFHTRADIKVWPIDVFHRALADGCLWA